MLLMLYLLGICGYPEISIYSQAFLNYPGKRSVFTYIIICIFHMFIIHIIVHDVIEFLGINIIGKFNTCQLLRVPQNQDRQQTL